MKPSRLALLCLGCLGILSADDLKSVATTAGIVSGDARQIDPRSPQDSSTNPTIASLA
jgi:hypothetical protein